MATVTRQNWWHSAERLQKIDRAICKSSRRLEPRCSSTGS